MDIILRPALCAVLCMGIVSLVNPALAQTAAPGAAAPAQQAQQTSPDSQFIQDIGGQAISVMADKGLPQDQKQQKYRGILQNSFDMQTIGKFVLGRYWNTASPQQQQDFMNLFQNIVLTTYGDKLSFYSGEGFKVTGDRKEDEKDTVVSSEVTHPNGAAPTKIDWRVRDNAGKPMIVDVVVEGVSQSVTQRQEYASIIQRNNGKIDALLDMMRQRTQGSGATQSD